MSLYIPERSSDPEIARLFLDEDEFFDILYTDSNFIMEGTTNLVQGSGDVIAFGATQSLDLGAQFQDVVGELFITPSNGPCVLLVTLFRGVLEYDFRYLVAADRKNKISFFGEGEFLSEIQFELDATASPAGTTFNWSGSLGEGTRVAAGVN